MAGHSKWANRKHRKARQDAKKGNIFSKMAREITIAAKEGGGDPDTNPRLRLAIDRAKQMSVPNDNIERALKRGTGDMEGVTYEEIRYEGYGPQGAAIMADVVTDNRNRTAQEIRHVFSKNGGNLGESGCVSWMFEQKGLIVLQGQDDEEEVFLLAVDHGAEDVHTEEEAITIVTSPSDLEQVRDALKEAGLEVSVAEITYLPNTQVEMSGPEAQTLIRLVDALEEHEDVQNVYGNFEITDDSLLEVEP